jgi:hypothetical protein
MILRDNSGISLTHEVRKNFPAVFNHKPAGHCSENYQLYRSDELIHKMEDRGMKLVEIGQQTGRKRPPETQLHTLRFQPHDVPLQFGVNDSVPEIVILNGHDGRNRFRAYAGIFRFICSNGMVVADQMLGQVVKRHFGESNTFDKVAAIVEELPESIAKMHGRILDWSALQLNENEQTTLALAMIKARQSPDWVTADKVLEARRVSEHPVDGERNLWTTFNVLQENLTNAKVTGREGDQRTAMRPISGAYRSVQANEALWTTADSYYRSKVDGLSEDEQEQLAKARKAAYERNRRAVKAVEDAPPVAEPETVDA